MDKLNIKNWMTREVLTADKEESVLSAVKNMASKNVGSVVVVEAGKPIGILTERDILERVVVEERDYLITKVKDVMTSGVTTIKADDNYTVACDIIRRHNIRHLPVVDNEGNLVGIVSIKDLTGYLKRDR